MPTLQPEPERVVWGCDTCLPEPPTREDFGYNFYNDIYPDRKQEVRQGDLQLSASEGCQLCKLIVASIETFEVPKDIKCEIKRHSAGDLYVLWDGITPLHCHVGMGLEHPWGGTSKFTAPETSLSVGKIRDFILENRQRCKSLHQACSPQHGTEFDHLKQRPARLINVGSKEKPPYLVEQSKLPLALQYVALSHCWGNTQPIRTMKATLRALTESINWPLLPKNFQDAITITRSLHIPFIWIDSLCIIQDDEDDWTTEAAKMASVYNNASMTFSLTGSFGASCGFIHPRGRVLEITDKDTHCERWHTLYLHPWIEHEPFFASPRSWRLPAELSCLPVLYRGWTLQEKLLSPQIVHFTRAELLWECNEGLYCECSLPIKDINRLRNHGSVSEGNRSTNDLRAWDGIVDRFVRRRLTFEEDRLPALSGLAAVFSQSGGRYLAGLWEAGLPLNLVWWCDMDPGRRPRITGTKGLKSAPPSWTWASVEFHGKSEIRILSIVGPDHPRLPEVDEDQYLYPELGHEWENQPLATIIEADCRPSTQNPLGIVSGGHLTIRGPLWELRPEFEKGNSWTGATDNYFPDVMSKRDMFELVRSAQGLLQVLMIAHGSKEDEKVGRRMHCQYGIVLQCGLSWSTVDGLSAVRDRTGSLSLCQRIGLFKCDWSGKVQVPVGGEARWPARPGESTQTVTLI